MCKLDKVQTLQFPRSSKVEINFVPLVVHVFVLPHPRMTTMTSKGKGSQLINNSQNGTTNMIPVFFVQSLANARPLINRRIELNNWTTPMRPSYSIERVLWHSSRVVDIKRKSLQFMCPRKLLFDMTFMDVFVWLLETDNNNIILDCFDWLMV